MVTNQWLIEPRVETTLARLEPLPRWSSLIVVERHNITGAWSVRGSYDDLAPIRSANRGVVISRNGVRVLSGRVTRIEHSDTESTVSGSSDFDVLDSRRVYPVPSANWGAQTTSAYDIRTGAAETVILGYINDNAGPNAYAGNATYSDRRTDQFIVPTSLGRGSTVRHTGRFGILSGLVARLAEMGGLHIDIIHDESTATPRRLLTVTPVLDRRNQVRFGTIDQLANAMVNPDWSYTIDAAAVTDALVAGGGTGTSRTNAYARDTTAITTWGGRVIEGFIDQRQTTDASELADAATEALADNSAPVQVDFTVQQPIDPTLVFGLGDLVAVNLKGVDLSNRVRERTTTVQLGQDSGTEQVQLVVGSRDATAWATTTQQRLLENERRIARLEAQ